MSAGTEREALIAAYAAVHADAVATLSAWLAPSPLQEELRQQFLLHLRDHPDGVAKAGPPAHLTASCLVLDETGSHLLLTHHRRADAWFQFGGHLDSTDASLWAAAAREAREESGLDVTPGPAIVHLDRHTLVGSFGRCREHLDVRYAARLPLSAQPRVSEESHDVRWFAVDALPARSGEELGGLIGAALRA